MTSLSEPGIFRVTTPEGVELEFKLASPIIRFLAVMIDAFLLLATISVLSIVLGMLGLISMDVAIAAITILAFVVSLLYAILFEWLQRGQTIGKRVMRIRVMDARGLDLQLDQAIIRNLVRVVDRLPIFYLVGGIVCYCTPDRQRLGDIAAGTVVTRLDHAAQPDVSRIMGDRYNSFRRHPHLQARLRRGCSPSAGALAMDMLRRRDTMDPDARLRISGEIADYFRSLASFPEEDTQGLSDEQYIRNAVDTLYNTEHRTA